MYMGNVGIFRILGNCLISWTKGTLFRGIHWFNLVPIYFLSFKQVFIRSLRCCEQINFSSQLQRNFAAISGLLIGNSHISLTLSLILDMISLPQGGLCGVKQIHVISSWFCEYLFLFFFSPTVCILSTLEVSFVDCRDVLSYASNEYYFCPCFCDVEMCLCAYSNIH
ncbi:hypothetical protein Lalb_Chr15g0083791 [Lupinus albus]|uniref:Uncharacterized protein n=1 Tax=Lupinus albus TaxID=3870 RepID=A0A6A4P1V1_LUPAL|nr:hypothetical protein Lalb_Chr15g0083791 [Lupinus albus]